MFSMRIAFKLSRIHADGLGSAGVLARGLRRPAEGSRALDKNLDEMARVLPRLPRIVLTRAEISDLAALRLAQVGLTGFEDYYPAELSGGMRKRAGLARALALDPDIVFFDEPSAGLDPVTSRHLDGLVRQVRDTFGTTIVIVSHELSSIYSLADRLIMLDGEARGIIAAGRARELARESPDPRVREFLRRDEAEQG